MIKQVMGEQINDPIWDSIKWGVVQVFQIKDKDVPKYTSQLIANIMNEAIQAWVVLGDDQVLKSFLLTRIIRDIFNRNVLLLDCIYGYEAMTKDEKTELEHHVREFAKNSNCGAAILYTSNAIVKRWAEEIGFKSDFTTYNLTL